MGPQGHTAGKMPQPLFDLILFKCKDKEVGEKKSEMEKRNGLGHQKRTSHRPAIMFGIAFSWSDD